MWECNTLFSRLKSFGRQLIVFLSTHFQKAKSSSLTTKKNQFRHKMQQIISFSLFIHLFLLISLFTLSRFLPHCWESQDTCVSPSVDLFNHIFCLQDKIIYNKLISPNYRRILLKQFGAVSPCCRLGSSHAISFAAILGLIMRLLSTWESIFYSLFFRAPR